MESAATTTASPVGPTPVGPTPQNLHQKLDAGERYWLWKLGLRALLVIVGIIGIGCMAWATSTALSSRGPYEYEYDDGWGILWTLITFGISVLWCSVCILVLIIRKKPVHPGAAVGIDLVLWLAYIPTAMFALIGVMSVLSWGEDGIIGRYSSYGYYYHAPNGTWVWNATDYDSYYGTTRRCGQEERYSNRYYGYGFDSCEEEDAYVNEMWKSKGHRAGVEITGLVCQFLGLVFHLALFIWACVDTHFRNQNKVSKEAEQLAADIVMKMVQSGAIIPAPAPVHSHPGHIQQDTRGAPPGGWVSQNQNSSMPAQTTSPQLVAPGSSVGSGEKSSSTRFA